MVARFATAARGGVDVDDRGVDPLSDVGKVDRANDGGPGRSHAERSRRQLAARSTTTGDWPTPPATMTPTRNATTDERARSGA